MITQRNMIELIREAAPQKGDAYIRILLNQALSEFSEQTLFLDKEAEITSVAGQLRYALEDDCIEVASVLDANGRFLTLSSPTAWKYAVSGDGLWWVEPGGLVLGYPTASSSFVPFEAGAVFTVRYKAQAPALTEDAMDSALPVPAPFQMALEARVRERLALGDVETQRYWHAIWRDQITKARKYVLRGRAGGSYNVIIHEF